MEVSPGIHQLKVPIPDNPLGNLLAYLVKGDRGYLLIDAGWPSKDGFKALERQVKDLGLSFADISTIVITHFHMDHFGLAAQVKEASGAQIAIHRIEVETPRPWRSKQDFEKVMAPILRRNGMPESYLDELMKHEDSHGPPPGVQDAFVADRRLEEGHVLDLGNRKLEIIWTPGHSPGHVCLYDRENRVLFSGDHILPVITPNVGLYPGSAQNPLGDFLRSLAKFDSLDVQVVLPAHEHVFNDLPQRLRQLRHHHEARLEAMLRSMDGGAKTAYDVASGVPWDIGPWKDFSAHDRRSAMAETMAHLEFLRREGRAVRSERDGRETYSPA